MDLIERGDYLNNRFPLSDALIARYREYIAVVDREGDHDKIHCPFWHFCGDGIWSIHDPSGAVLYRPGDNAASSPSVKWLREHMGHASLEPALFHELCDPVVREQIRIDPRRSIFSNSAFNSASGRHSQPAYFCPVLGVPAFSSPFPPFHLSHSRAPQGRSFHLSFSAFSLTFPILALKEALHYIDTLHLYVMHSTSIDPDARRHCI